jgi:tRNA A37 methylthiotransferase MiaB
MVGHPGEDSAAFNELLDLWPKPAFDVWELLCISGRRHLRAMNLEDRITEKVKASRYKRLWNCNRIYPTDTIFPALGKHTEYCRQCTSGDEEVRGTVALGRTMYEAPE